MKTKIRFMVAVLAMVFGAEVFATTITFSYWRPDFTVWASTNKTANIYLFGTNTANIYSKTNTYNGHEYRLDPSAQELVIDNTTHVSLSWNTPGQFTLQTHYGFAIDRSGVGWIATSDSDSDNASFLLYLNLGTGLATYYDYIGPGSEDGHLVNGLAITYSEAIGGGGGD